MKPALLDGYAVSTAAGAVRAFAGAVPLSYDGFLGTARHCHESIKLRQQRLHLGFDAVCHRLRSMQRSGARGWRFCSLRRDQAGDIAARPCATAVRVARHGDASPMWQAHEAFTQPARMLTRVPGMPDGTCMLRIARAIGRDGVGIRSRSTLFAIGLDCELPHACTLVYADVEPRAFPRPARSSPATATPSRGCRTVASRADSHFSRGAG